MNLKDLNPEMLKQAGNIMEAIQKMTPKQEGYTVENTIPPPSETFQPQQKPEGDNLPKQKPLATNNEYGVTVWKNTSKAGKEYLTLVIPMLDKKIPLWFL